MVLAAGISVCSEESKIKTVVFSQFETRLKDRYVTDFSVRWRSDKNGVIFQRQEQQEVAEKTGECSLLNLKMHLLHTILFDFQQLAAYTH